MRRARACWALGCWMAAGLLAGSARGADPWLVVEGGEGPGKGKKIVLVSGDEEYRSEEGLPQLAKVLAKRHGFTCTVLFAIDPKDGTINPEVRDNIPGLDALDSADLLILFTRFRDLPDDQMKHVVDYVESGRPIIGMRTATHAFDIKPGKTYSKWSWNSKEWPGGFGKQVLGETWVAHHGQHGVQSTRGVPCVSDFEHPVLNGIWANTMDIWGPTDVYAVHLPADCTPVVNGRVLKGMKPSDDEAEGKVNDPMMPVAWTRVYKEPNGKSNRIFATTMGASQDLQSADLRRLLVNAAYWCLEMQKQLPEKPKKEDVEIVGEYKPTPFGFGKHRKGVKPEDLAGK